MKNSKLFVALLLVFVMTMSSALGCTIFMAGKDATVDGSTMCSQTDDSGSADFRLWIIPRMEGGEGITRDLVVDSHNYGDYGQFPAVKDYGNGYAVATIPQPEETNAYLHSRYSFINDQGLAIGECTNSAPRALRDIIWDKDYLIDAWNLQDLALEQCDTAREACAFMGSLIDQFGFKDASETFNVSDGNETWLFEMYGNTLWCAVRIPDNAFTVAANRAVINYIDFEDTENYMWSENIVSFAVEKGLWDESEGLENFSPARAYCPSESAGCQMREWRAFDLVAPSLGLKVEDKAQGAYPLYVVPDKKLSVQDLYEMAGDYYAGTEFDKSRQVYAGDFGNVLDSHHTTRSINVPQTCYWFCSNVRADLPAETRCLVWYGHGAADTSFLTPMWPSQYELAPQYTYNSDRYSDMDLNAAWWISMFVQDIAMVNYNHAAPIIHERRDSFMVDQYTETYAVQEEATKLVEAGKVEEARQMLTDYHLKTAARNFETWIDLGWELHGDLTWGRVNMKSAAYSDWWKGIIASGPVTTITSSAPGNKPL